MLTSKANESRHELLAGMGLPHHRHKPYRQVIDLGVSGLSHEEPVPANASCMLALIATRGHVPYADLAARSFLKHHPEFKVFLLLVDGSEADRDLFPYLNIILLNDLALTDVGWLAAKLDPNELSNALKPILLEHLAAFGNQAVYLDCDIAVFGRFDTLMSALQTSDLVLTPHMMELFPRPEEQWRHPNNADIFNSGLINAGCFGIDLTRCTSFLAFWREANLKHAWANGEGRQTDQQFLNWALVTGHNVHVLQDKTYNVAYWNLHERSLRQIAPLGDALVFEVEGKPLTFFHFSGFDPHDTLRLSRHDHRYSVYTLPSIALILEWYSGQVFSGSLSYLLNEPYAFDVLGNGIRLTSMLRNILKRYDSYLQHVDTTTVEGADALCAALMTPLPATGSRLPLIAAEIYEARPDLQEGYPNAHVDLQPHGFSQWFLHHAGGEYQIEPLIAKFRRVLDSDSLAGFVSEIRKYLPETLQELKILGVDRQQAASEFRILGRADIANALLSGENEWSFFSDFSAILKVYEQRPDLQTGFPDPFGRDHGIFLSWLMDHGTREHGLSLATAKLFAEKSRSQVMARIFSLLSRRDDLGDLAVSELLSDNPVRLIRELLRNSGEGLEYDLADVEVFCFIHQNARACLIPLYLELPTIRRQTLSSRTPEGREAFLPVSMKLDWVQVGCRLHESYFSPADVALEREIRVLRARMMTTNQDVISVLHASRLEIGARQLTRLAEKQALRALRQANEHVEPPLASAAAPGVNLFGFFLANTGVGESTRGLEKALSFLTGVQRMHQFTSHLEQSARIEDVLARYDHHADCNIFVSYPHAHEDLFGRLPREMTERRRNIIHLAWEQKDWNTHWRSIYGRYDEVWAISDFAAIPFREMLGPDKVRVVPNVLLVDDFPSTAEAARDRFTRPVFRFLFVFDANSSIERKNPEAVLEAFTAAFAGTGWAAGVELILKVNNLDRPEHGARVAKLRRMAAASGLEVVFDGRQLARNEILMLIASADCYVSLHRAEGFGYTMAEAMYLGVPVIASGYSGNLEYMTPEDSYLVPCTEVLVQNADGPFQRGSIWGQPDIAVAIDMMRTVVENRDAARLVGERAASAVRRKLLPEVVAEGLRPALHMPSMQRLRQAR